MGKVRIEKGENTVSILNQIGVLAWPYPNKDTMIELNSPFSARFRISTVFDRVRRVRIIVGRPIFSVSF